MKSLLKTIIATALMITCSQNVSAQGWPENYGGVMLQGFYWDSFAQSKWTKLESQAEDFASTFDLIWVPQSGNCGGTSMGYDDLYWFPGGNHYTSSFGTEQELRNMISTFKSKGIGTIADVVVNHRKNVSNWVDFPTETYQGVTYQMTSTDICKDDDGGATLSWANSNGYSLSPNNDSGEGWDGMRDLDHLSTNVQNICKAYTKMLIDDLGYTGFRYDMVKGFSGSYVGAYNNYAKPQFSVGECWDGTNTIKNWIEATGKTSAAFDFQFRYTVRNAINSADWSKLGEKNDGSWPLISNDYNSGNYRQYAVTFVENHDTEKRANAEQDPIKKDTLAANAYLLAMPGTPCVFYKHWLDYKDEIKAMVAARKLAGITNQSTYSTMRSTATYYANSIKVGGANRLMVVVGSNPDGFIPSSSTYTLILSGYHYRYYLANALETAWADKASGVYDGAFKVKLTAVSATSGAQLVYTTNGTTPTVSSQKVNSGTEINITESCTLKVGILVGGVVKGIIERNYTIEENTFDPKTITVYCRVGEGVTGWTTMNYWTWSDFGHAPANTSWPGDRITATKTVDGYTWYYKEYTLTSEEDYVNFVFSNGSGSPQSVDVNNVQDTKYFVIRNQKDGAGHYYVDDVTATTSIDYLRSTLNPQSSTLKIYTIDGRLLRSVPAGASVNDAINSLPRGIYIVNGKKVVK
ncbi:MAG: chitobiase/beta-hexosaminidase C-terminal domain-containing protein [Prevotella sp.]|nr:chitobiase/beta-hexosaminidase C-terminal domain-containing protein [Prevotella sp.]